MGGRDRSTALVDLMGHDLDLEPAVTFTNDGYIGLRTILEECATDLDYGTEEDGAR
jgi:hypothetical protein